MELWASLVTGSLALLSDAGHVLVDVSGLLVATVALRIASRPATPQATYGFFRAEVLAAAFNGFLLVGIASLIVYRAVGRLRHPLESLDHGTVLWVAIIGLAANLIPAWLLRHDAQENINTRGAWLNVLGDAVASVGVIISALLVGWTGDVIWDTLVSFFVAIIIVWGGSVLIRSAFRILLEATPAHLDLPDLKRQIESVDGVVNVHDLHVWTLTPGRCAATLHVTIEPERTGDYHVVVREIEALMAEGYGLVHCTIQVEPAGLDHDSDEYDPLGIAGDLS